MKMEKEIMTAERWIEAEQAESLLEMLTSIERVTSKTKGASCLHTVPMEETEFDNLLAQLEAVRLALESACKFIQGCEIDLS